jgi:hypothetical protein
VTPSTHLLPSTSCRVAQFDSPSFTGLLAKLANREQTKIRSGPQFCSPDPGTTVPDRPAIISPGTGRSAAIIDAVS